MKSRSLNQGTPEQPDLDRWTLDWSSPDGIPEGQIKANCTLHHGDWAQVLHAGFGASACWASHPKVGPALITVFPAGPFRIAYLGFPVGRPAGMNYLPPQQTESLVAALKQSKKVDLFRLDSESATDLARPGSEKRVSRIYQLQSWSLAGLAATIRRNVRKAEKSGVQIVPATPADSGNCFEIYANTVARHGQRPKYSRKYFEALFSLANKPQSGVYVNVAVQQGKGIGFMVVADQAETAFYLHGGFASRAAQYRPTDALFAYSINAAKLRNRSCFDMLASPLDQPGLIRFKEKWGAKTEVEYSMSIPIRGIRAGCFGLAQRFYELLSPLLAKAQR